MKMTRLEKQFINRRKKAERNIDKVRQHLQQLDIQAIRDVLELGCGIGVVSAFLADSYGMNVQGTDFDPGQIEIARTMQPESDRLHFGIEDAVHLTFNDASFDLVLSQNVFHHIPDWEGAVREVARVLRIGGYLMWLDLVFPKVVKSIFQPIVKNYGLYTSEEIEAAFADSGLASRSCKRRLHGPFVHYDMLLQKN